MSKSQNTTVVQTLNLAVAQKQTEKIALQPGQAIKLTVDGQLYTGQKVINGRVLHLVRKNGTLVLEADGQALAEVAGFFPAQAETAQATPGEVGAADDLLGTLDAQTLFESGSSVQLAAADAGTLPAISTPSWGTLIAQAAPGAVSTSAATTTAAASTAAAATAVSAGAVLVATVVAAAVVATSSDDDNTPGDTTPPTLQSVTISPSGNGKIVLTYSEALDAANPPQTTQFAVTTGGNANVVTAVEISGNTVILTLTTAVTAGQAVSVTYTDATVSNDTQAIQDASGNDAATATGGFTMAAASDGYIRGAKIYIDTNGNGVADAAEDTGVVTNAQGSFVLPDNAPSGPIIAVGGVNIDTGVPNTLVLKAPAGAAVVTPLTTMVQTIVENYPGTTEADAETNVLNALGITVPVGKTLTSYDAIADGNVAVQKAAVQLATLITQVRNAAEADGDATTTTTTATNTVLDNLATQLATGNAIDLTNNITIATLIGGAVNDESVADLVNEVDMATTAIGAANSIADISTAQAEALDTIAPSTPKAVTLVSDTGLVGDNKTNDTKPILKVSFDTTASDGTAAVAGDTVKVYSGLTEVGSATLTATDISRGYAEFELTTDLTGTSATLTAKITDIAANTSSESGSLAITLDTTPPAKPVVALDSDTGVTNDNYTSAGVVNVGELETGATWQYSTDNGNTWTNGTGSRFTLTGAGDKTVLVRQTDNAGNTSDTETLSFTLDTAAAAPTLALAADTGTNTGDSITNNGQVNVSGLETGATWQYSTNGGSTWTEGTGTSFTLTGDGDKSAIVRQTDKALNTSASSSALAFTLDNTLPTITAAYNVAENTATYTDHLSVTLAASESVTWSGLTGTDAGAFTLGTGANAGKLMFEGVTDKETKDSYTVTVTGTDDVGNATSQEVTVTVDNVNEAPTTVGEISAQTAVLNQPFTSLNVASYFADVDANDPGTYTLTAGALPAGLSLNAETGAITGTATATAASGSYTITRTDAGGLTATQTFDLSVVDKPSVLSFTVADTDDTSPNTDTKGNSGETLQFVVTLSEAVTSEGSITAVFTVNGVDVTATSEGVEGESTLTLFGTVPATGNGSTITLKSLTGTITGNLSGLPLLAPTDGAISHSGYTVDNTLPTITAAYNVAENTATYTDHLSVTLAANESVTWSGLTGTDAGAFTLGTGANAGKLMFEGVTDKETKDSYTVTVTGTDDVGNATSQEVTVTVDNVNEAPTTVGEISAQTAVVGQALALADFTVADVDSATVTVTLTATNGTIGGVDDDDANTAGIQVTGTVSAVNTALAEATFTATEVGEASVGIAVTDGSLTALGTYSLTAVTAPSLSTTLGSTANAAKKLDVTSKIVLSATETVTAVDGQTITITETDSTGFMGESVINTFVITLDDAGQHSYSLNGGSAVVSASLVTISGEGADTKIIIDLPKDLDFASTYTLEVADGAFLGTETEQPSAAFSTVTFDTVTPGAEKSTTATSYTGVSHAMNTAGAMEESYTWLDTSGWGSKTGTATAIDLAAKNFALVVADLDSTPVDSETAPSNTGVTTGNFHLDVSSFALGDLLYVDNLGRNTELDATQGLFDINISPIEQGRTSFNFDPTNPNNTYMSAGSDGGRIDVLYTSGTTTEFDTLAEWKTLLSTPAGQAPFIFG